MIRGFGPKKPKQQRKEKRKDVPFMRLSAKVKSESSSQVSESRVFLQDLSPGGVGIFTNLQFPKGDRVSIVIEQPKTLYVRGEVMWCNPYTFDTKVLSADQYKYRAGIRFVYDSPEEEAAVKSFCEDLYSGKVLG